MKDILYFNTLENIKLVNMMRVKKGDVTRYKTNGYTYVDLGLPSGTLWATMNVGAESETDIGLYFAWGETQGYPVQLVDDSKEDMYEVVGRSFSIENYQFAQWSEKNQLYLINKYYSGDEKTVLDLEDDAAHVNMGGDWRMPSPTQIEELLNTDYVTNEFVENYNSSGVCGVLFTSVVDNTKKLFIPFNGDINQNINEFNQIQIWSNKVSEGTVTDANLLFGDPDSYESKLRIDQYYRYFGLGVRGVIGGNKNTTTDNRGHSIDVNNDKPGYVPDLGNGGNLDVGNGEIGGNAETTPLKP